VDRAYHYEQMLSSIQHARQESSSIVDVSTAVETTLTPEHVDSKMPSATIGPLSSLFADFARNLMFQPENELEEEPVFLNKLPEELLVMIIVTLDTTSIERFARVCKKARIMTLDPVIWMYVSFPLPRLENDNPVIQ
jgi:F-box protein 9